MNDTDKKTSFPIKLYGYFRNLEKEFPDIPEKRKEKLLALSNYISEKIKNGKTPEIIVICTHNSRRSHMGQLWLKTAAAFYGIDLKVYSGGTEATAFHPNAVRAFRTIGFDIQKTTEDENPVYECTIGNGGPTLVMFSKKYDHPNNVQKDFAALMVCRDADEACPVVMGADGRFPIAYKDPKVADGTEIEESKYAERCHQIGREMFFVVSRAV